MAAASPSSNESAKNFSGRRALWRPLGRLFALRRARRFLFGFRYARRGLGAARESLRSIASGRRRAAGCGRLYPTEADSGDGALDDGCADMMGQNWKQRRRLGGHEAGRRLTAAAVMCWLVQLVMPDVCQGLAAPGRRWLHAGSPAEVRAGRRALLHQTPRGPCLAWRIVVRLTC